ncbi:ABC-2 type transport system ATP-binding protein [Clostridium cavendishii DSM 21758]|uniref:ABC-2 type transport system ATP-binding protein n=1 Tax=Clostridium cavendishii DSM 21758 TaxID=1121302 RepID=A0A1M6ED87_9CLOT|nr:ABC transporter ATP-binding protein [Clostridium cavendishii]SHI83435.1 ABC-2 type transport system ATP-binding protein [Clostridium cavendishii DSM 21758]
MENILEINDLTRKFKHFELKNISFKLPKGFVMGLIGPNGAGKTTTLKLIMNFMCKNDGEIKVFGLDNIENEREIKDKIGFIYGEGMFNPYDTAKSIGKTAKMLYSSWEQEKYSNYLTKFNIPQKTKVGEMSKGTQMKLSIAVALSHNAELLLMDEPTAGLDPISRREFLDMIYDFMQDENKGVIFSTHITSDLERIADYLTCINNGEIVFSESRDVILEKYGVVKCRKGLLKEEHRELFVDIQENRFGVEALTTNKELIREFYGEDVVIDEPSIEDVMCHMVKK